MSNHNLTLRALTTDLMIADDTTRNELAKSIGMPYATLAGILNGTRNGSMEAWDLILGHFGYKTLVGITAK